MLFDLCILFLPMGSTTVLAIVRSVMLGEVRGGVAGWYGSN